MAQQTVIGWTDVTWNPTFGCSKVSPGCAHCYAETMALRLRLSPRPWTPANATTNVVLKHRKLYEPLSYRKPFDKPRRVFVNSMSDLFHELVPESYIAQVFDVMRRADRHQFQILTKRHERLAELAPRLPWPENIWMGVSIENRRFVHRADFLRQVPAAVRFISAEPLIGSLLAPWNDGYKGPELDLDGIDWLIVGGESGPGFRRMDLMWAFHLLARCEALHVPFFFKQNSGPRTEMGIDALGQVIRDYPTPKRRWHDE